MRQPAPLNGNQKAGLIFIGLVVVAIVANELLDGTARCLVLVVVGVGMAGALVLVADGHDAW